MKETCDSSFGPIGLPVRPTDPFYEEKGKCDRAKGNCPKELCFWSIGDVEKVHLWYEFGANPSIIYP